MAVVTYQLLFGTMPLKPAYIHLQMADQTFQKVEGIVTDVPIKIYDHFVHTDFQVIDMGEDDTTATKGGKSSRTDGQTTKEK